MIKSMFLFLIWILTTQDSNDSNLDQPALRLTVLAILFLQPSHQKTILVLYISANHKDVAFASDNISASKAMSHVSRVNHLEVEGMDDGTPRQDIGQALDHCTQLWDNNQQNQLSFIKALLCFLHLPGHQTWVFLHFLLG